MGATLHRGVRASHYCGLSCCGAQAPDAQAQQLWLTGLVALRHVGSSRTRARTRVPCIGRQILNHCATREAPICILKRKTLRYIRIHTVCYTCIKIVYGDLPTSIIVYTWNGPLERETGGRGQGLERDLLVIVHPFVVFGSLKKFCTLPIQNIFCS